MATILLQAAGAYIGGLLGPIGATIGTAAGAVAGYMLDRALITGTQRIEGPRLTGARPFTAEEGVSLPRIYGTARLGGTLIWATRFQEVSETSRQGKFGPKVTEYSYFANAAFALCEGKVAGIRRVWADGKELDVTTIELRVYNGAEDQLADPLIEAKQGAGNTSAYRGTAYVVVDNLDIGPFGNRLPQLQFEVLRPLGTVPGKIKAVGLIPGATEYGLATSAVEKEIRPGESEAVNRHVLHAGSDIAASLDELQMLCPELEHVALVVSWFGNNLRAGECRIRPAVTTRSGGMSEAWHVAGLDRATADLISTHDGGPAYGGTPSDQSVKQAIAEIRSRGLKVTFYPFIMMDVPADTTLPDPYGGGAQPAYPWRGRITCDPAPLQPGSTDKTALAREQIEAFCGSGSGDWGYRRFVLHNAHLAEAAGGVDAFLIGTELRGLTTLRDETGAFPFVEALCTLADDVRGILGAQTKLTYGADWSEYFGHHPQDGSGDVVFHLDPLWSHPEIDAVGIDNYMPLSDWRDADHADGNPDGFASPYDLAGLKAGIAGGEGFDWYYASAGARLKRERSAISDGAYGKPWVYRYKDLVNWWSNPHHDRNSGVEAALPTAWQPSGKPIWFTELGCPAVDKGPNQPNVFPDPKSVENAVPYFSSGGRSDTAAQRFLQAHLGHWDAAADGFSDAANPASDVYAGRMVEASRCYIWAWDARPFPAFPLLQDSWADAGNWQLGHWLNGRASGVAVGDVISAVLADHGLPKADVSGVEGTVQGYVVSDGSSVRATLEPLQELFDLAVLEQPERLLFRQATSAGEPVEIDELVAEGDATILEQNRVADSDLPVEAMLNFRDPMKDHQAGSARSRRVALTGAQAGLSLPGTLEAGQAAALADEWLQRNRARREQLSFAIAGPRDDLVPGALVRLPGRLDGRDFLVTQIEDGLTRRIQASEIVRTAPVPWMSSEAGATAPTVLAGRPHVLFLDLPLGAGSDEPLDQFRLAIHQRPWRTQAVLVSPETSGFTVRGQVTRKAGVGRLTEALAPGLFSGRPDRSAALTVEMYDAELSSVSRAQLLNGANALAVGAVNGIWEVLQFEHAEEVMPGIWRLTGLLRGQLGTEDAMAAGASAGADVVVLDDAVAPAGLLAGEVGLELNWRIGPAGMPIDGSHFVTQAETGGLRASMPLAPVHLSATSQAGGGIALRWIRRSRVDADNWTAAEISLGEVREEYRVSVATVDGTLKRSAVVTEPSWLYAAAEVSADFFAADEALVTVEQWSAAVGWGLPATLRISV